MTQHVPAAEIAKVRAFNRSYTQAFGFLRDRLDGSPFALTEARVLYEIAQAEGPTAAEIGRALDLDKAQLSRVLAKLRRSNLVKTSPSPQHAKHLLLSLTQKGKQAFEALNAATQKAIGAKLASLPPDRRAQLVQSMNSITASLTPPGQMAAAFSLRDPTPGDLGWITHRQAVLYAEEYGWDWTYEALVSRILGEFVESFDPKLEKAWVAMADGRIAGSIFLMKSGTPETAKLRLLYVEPWARGRGIGAALVAACIAEARKMGYTALELWTNSVLTSARRIYEAAGFMLVDEKPHHSFGKDLVGQTWRLDLLA